jgi:nicotinamide-nucleotide amidase
VRVTICSVGAELLTGHIVDTNAAWLAARVIESGATMASMMIVDDDHTQIVESLRWLADRADVLVVGGGLGPTADDLTRDAVAAFAGVGLERRAALTAHLDAVYERLDREMPTDALRQADIPATAEVHAPKGTAAGFSLDVAHDDRVVRVHVLPGVPWEYKDLADRVVLPDLVARSGGRARITRTVHVAGMGESAIGAALRDLSDRLAGARNVPDDPDHGIELSYLANSDEVLVRVSATGDSPHHARDRAAPFVDLAVARLGEAVTSIDERRLEQEVVQLLESLGATVATAEGFTAGRVGTAISSVPGAAAVLRGGIVAYAPELLGWLLAVDPPVTSAADAVTPAVVEQMARAARDHCGADYAVATAGIVEEADATEERPVGTAVWAVALPDGTVHVEEHFIPAGNRDIIQARGGAFALESLRRQLAVARAAGGASGLVTP